ncbi:MAG: hypothetical protein LBJ77_01055 [Holosporales bacterium]|jgi:hypothetical protein|nr:hypothetical protein [Holosporales bacterium]
MILCWACHSVHADDSTDDTSKYDMIIEWAKQKKQKAAQTGPDDALLQQLHTILKALEERNKKATSGGDVPKVTPHPYFDIIRELQEKLRELIAELLEYLAPEGSDAVREGLTILTFHKNAIPSELSEATAELHSLIDQTIPQLEGLAAERQRLTAIGRATCLVFADTVGVLDDLSVLDGRTPVSKQDLTKMIHAKFRSMILPVEGRKEVDNLDSTLTKEFAKLDTLLPAQIAYKTLVVVFPYLEARCKNYEKLGKLCYRKLDATVGAENQLMADIKDQIDSPDTSESVKIHLKMHSSTIEGSQGMLVNFIKKLKDSDASIIRNCEKFSKELVGFTKTKPEAMD